MTDSTVVHSIRLRGPWRLIPEARAIRNALGDNHYTLDGLPAETTQQMPDDWGAALGQDFRGRVRYQRDFGKPTNLDPDEEVWLVSDGVDQTAEFLLNGLALGGMYRPDDEWRYCITKLLTERNQLIVIVDCPADGTAGALLRTRNDQPGGLIGEVRLHITRLNT